MQARARRPWLLAPLALALGVLVCEGLVRSYARLGGPGGPELAGYDPLAFPYEPFGVLGYRQKPGTSYRFPNGVRATINAMGFRGPLVGREKPPGTFRAVLLGGSCAYGWGVPEDETIDAYLQEELARRHPGVRFEVVNLALSAYDSYQALERLRADGIPLSPDLVIAHLGINDVRNAHFPDLARPDPRTLFYQNVMARLREEAEQGGPSAWTLAKHHSYLARLPGFLRMRLRREPAAPADAFVEAHPDAADYFEANLRDIAQLATDSGAALLLSRPPSRMDTDGVPPEANEPNAYWLGDAETTRAYRELLFARMQAVAADVRNAPVRYLTHQLAPGDFSADCHLESSGNRGVARGLADAADPTVRALFPVGGSSRRGGNWPNTRGSRDRLATVLQRSPRSP